MKRFLLLSFLTITCMYSSQAQKERFLVTIQGDTIRQAPGEFFPIFSKAEMEPQFRGGAPAWHKFIRQNLVYPDSLRNAKVEGTVWVQFIIHTDGRVCDLEAIGGVEALKETALATMRKSPLWDPATQGGRLVTCYKKQSIVFRLSDQ